MWEISNASRLITWDMRKDGWAKNENTMPKQHSSFSSTVFSSSWLCERISVRKALKRSPKKGLRTECCVEKEGDGKDVHDVQLFLKIIDIDLQLTAL